MCDIYSMINNNLFSYLYIESDDEYEQCVTRERETLRDKKKEKYDLKQAKRHGKYLENIKQAEQEYARNIKRTKVFAQHLQRINYVSEIKENYCNIADYLSLDTTLISMVSNNRICYNLFGDKEYLEMVKIMELNKNPVYASFGCLLNIRDIQHKIEKVVVGGYGSDALLIYQIYLIFLMDTKCVRKVLSSQPEYKYLMDFYKKDLKDKLTRQWSCVSEFECEYYNTYFEIGKRYFAKRNNFKVLFRNYVKCIGKFAVIRKNIK